MISPTLNPLPAKNVFIMVVTVRGDEQINKSANKQNNTF